MSNEQQPKLEVNITSYDLNRALEAALDSAIQQRLDSTLTEVVEAAVEKRVGEAVKALSTEIIAEQIRKTLTEGWTKTNQWGEPISGTTTTLATVVRDQLEALSKKPERYHSDSRPNHTPMEAIVVELAAKAVKEGLEPVLADAKKAFQSQLEVSMGKSLRLTLADALKG